MGTNIYSRAERRENGKWISIPGLRSFDWRDYGLFAFLAGVRNYSDTTPISAPRGLPDDIPQEEDDDYWLGRHSHSWLSLEELMTFDYDKRIEGRRVIRQVSQNVWSRACTAAPSAGTPLTDSNVKRTPLVGDSLGGKA